LLSIGLAVCHALSPIVNVTDAGAVVPPTV
jgi:hypothetical protein